MKLKWIVQSLEYVSSKWNRNWSQNFWFLYSVQCRIAGIAKTTYFWNAHVSNTHVHIETCESRLKSHSEMTYNSYLSTIGQEDVTIAKEKKKTMKIGSV